MVPIRIDNVYLQGLARRLGVEMGWYLQKVNDAVLAGESFDRQFAIIKLGMAVLPVTEEFNVAPTLQSLEIVFDAGCDSQHVPVTFSKKPLGFEFDLIAPIKVKNIQQDCVAKRHGVEVGWVVKKVAGIELSTKSFKDQVDMLKKSVASLPDVTYCIAPPLCHSLSANLCSTRAARATDTGCSDNSNEGRL